MAAKVISENIEEYLEVLYKFGGKNTFVSTTTLSHELGIAPGSVTQMLKKLEDLGYIEYTPYKGASLTTEGIKIAQKITRKHRILEKFLKEILKIKDENIHEQACEMEHSLSDEAERAICHMLEHPDTCPGNSLIPACDFDYANCEDCMADHTDIDDIKIRESSLLSVTELHHGEEGVISFIRGNPVTFAEIIGKGVIKDSQIKIEEPVGDKYNVIIDGSLVELPEELANNIFVKVF